jgi:hypothetical protein
VPTPIERRQAGRRAGGFRRLSTLLALTLVGCGEPSARELKNRQEFEALLTAVSLKNKAQLEKDARRIDDRHASGELSDGSYQDLQAIIKKARGGDWGGAEKQAYEFREARPYFK